MNIKRGSSIIEIHNLLTNSKVLVWKEGKGTEIGKWKGSFRLLKIKREICNMKLTNGSTKFKATTIQSFY